MKSTRDAFVTGSPTALVLAVLMEHGVPVETATLASIVTGFLAATAYRAIRRRWPWLMGVDAPGR